MRFIKNNTLAAPIEYLNSFDLIQHNTEAPENPDLLQTISGIGGGKNSTTTTSTYHTR